MKKIIVTLLTVGIILAESAIPVFAQDIWILDETEKAALKREHPFSSSYWEYAEAEAEVRYWVEQHKGEINSISDEVERYKAVAKEVCDFLTYDFKYGTPHIHFTLRDGKGVCSDYSTLTKGLCDSVGLQCVSVNGYSPNGPHSWNRVVLNGMTYDSDLSSSDLYGTPILMEGTPSSYREEDICEDLYSICCWTGSVVEEDSYDIADTFEWGQSHEGKVIAAKVSNYAAESPLEAFAESFVAYQKGEDIPESLKNVVEGAIKEVGGKIKPSIAKRGVSGTMKMNLQTFANVPKEKLVNYALNPTHPVGKEKARAFKSALGYTQENSEDLRQKILGLFSEDKMVLKYEGEYGKQYEQVMKITGPNGKTANVLTAWIKENDSSEPRLVTLYVTDKEGE